jgi:hypothetical protein
MNRHFKIANSVSAGQIAHRVAGKEQDEPRLARSLAQLAQRVPLIR